jgi:predicted HTH domain antitoxin
MGSRHAPLLYSIMWVSVPSADPAKEKVTIQLRLQVPEQLTGKSQQQLEALAFEALVVRLYALGELSSGEGAKLLGLTRREFLDLLGQYNVSLFDNEMDLKKEAGNG